MIEQVRGTRLQRIGLVAAQALVGVVPLFGFLIAMGEHAGTAPLVIANWLAGANAAAGTGAAMAGKGFRSTSANLIYAISAPICLGIEVGRWRALSPVIIAAWVIVGCSVYWVDRHPPSLPRRGLRTSGTSA